MSYRRLSNSETLEEAPRLNKTLANSSSSHSISRSRPVLFLQLDKDTESESYYALP